MKLLDLFSGIGGFSYGLEKIGFKTVAFCEMDKYCKLVLQKHWKGVKIYNDVKEITKEKLESDGVELPDIITGGFPCQPFSVAGKQKGTSDDRYLWPEMFRIIKEFKPRWVIGENVRNIISIQNGMVFENVCTDLEGEGYEVRAFNIPAASVGAPHRRERIWIVAILGDSEHDGSSTSEIERSFDKTSDDNKKRQNQTSKFKRTSRSRNSEDVANAESIKSREQTQRQGWENFTGRSFDSRGDSKKRSEDNVANASAGRRASQEEQISTRGNGTEHQSWWSVEPDVGRVAHGVPGRIHRLRALGNSIVPKVAEEIGRAIMKAERD